MPLPAALIPLAGAIKGLGVGAAAKGVAGAVAKKGGLRMAGEALKGTGKFFLNNMGRTKGEVAMRVAPDLFFGGMAGLNTPGDLGDKLIAGTTQAAGGVLGGVGGAGLARKVGLPQGAEFFADMAGSVVGDYGGMYTGDALMRAKGGGMTPYERLAAEGDAARQREIEERLMRAYGIAGHRPLDPFFADNGLGG